MKEGQNNAAERLIHRRNEGFFGGSAGNFIALSLFPFFPFSAITHSPAAKMGPTSPRARREGGRKGCN